VKDRAVALQYQAKMQTKTIVKVNLWMKLEPYSLTLKTEKMMAKIKSIEEADMMKSRKTIEKMIE
jgi:hypothetical protein